MEPIHGDKIAAKRQIIRYTGIFDFDGLYKVMVQWLKQRRYWFHEDTYKFKPGDGFGKEVMLKWVAWKNIDEYFRFHLTVNFHIWDINEVEIFQDGQKKTLTKARMEIKLKCTLYRDWQRRYKQNKLTEFLKDFYNKYIIFKKTDSITWDTIYYRMLKFAAVIKDYLNMETKGREYAGYLGDNV